MSAVLSRLLLWRFRAGIRYRAKQLATLKGAVFLALTVGVVWLLIASRAAGGPSGFDLEYMRDPILLREQIRNFMPLSLFGVGLLTVFTASGPALYFSAAEVNFLFAGPFTRRSLVLYKFLAYAFGAVLSASIIAVLLPPRTSTSLAAFVGALLTLLFIQLLSTLIRMAALTMAGRVAGLARHPAVVFLLLLVVAVGLYAAAAGLGDLAEQLTAIRNSGPGKIVLAPFVVFTELFLAPRTYPDLVGWAATGTAINIALLAAVVQLDKYTFEQSLAANRRLAERWQRLKRGGSMWASQSETARSLPTAPVWGGLGAVAWRQRINATRNSGRAMAVLFLIAVIAGPTLVSAETEAALWGRIGLVFFFAVYVVPRTLVLDFRGELASMEYYKALPLAPWRLCAGQLIVPVLLTSAVEAVLAAGAALLLNATAALVVVVVAAFTLPFNLLLYSVENLLFLLFPKALVPVGRFDFDFFGRTLLEFMIKTLFLLCAGTAAAGSGLLVLRATGTSWLWFGIVSWCALAAIGAAMLPLLAWAFRHFKVSEAVD